MDNEFKLIKRDLLLKWKINWHLKENNYTTQELKYVIEHLQEIVKGSEWDSEPLSSMLKHIQEPTSENVDNYFEE